MNKAIIGLTVCTSVLASGFFVTPVSADEQEILLRPEIGFCKESVGVQYPLFRTPYLPLRVGRNRVYYFEVYGGKAAGSFLGKKSDNLVFEGTSNVVGFDKTTNGFIIGPDALLGRPRQPSCFKVIKITTSTGRR